MATVIRWIIAVALAMSATPWAFYVLVQVWQGKGSLLPQTDTIAIGVGTFIGLLLVF